MKGRSPSENQKRPRRAITPDEAEQLLEAARRGPVVHQMAGPDRAVLYMVALGTEFRANELASLKPESFRLQADPPTVHLKTGAAKNRKEAVQPIAKSLADAPGPWIAHKPPGTPIFHWTKGRTADMLRADLGAAKIAYETRDGFLDFHALRASYITNLVSSWASVKTAQTLARHSSPVLTIGRYAKVQLQDVVGAVEALPDPTGGAPQVGVQGLGDREAPNSESASKSNFEYSEDFEYELHFPRFRA